MTLAMPSSSHVPATRPEWSKTCVQYDCGCGGSSGRYDGRIVSSCTEERVSTPKNDSITHTWGGMSVRTLPAGVSAHLRAPPHDAVASESCQMPHCSKPGWSCRFALRDVC